MEKAVGIICEFNPFHFGHKHLLAEVKKAFPAKGIVCVMSGNFVQRGSFAIMEKYKRAEAALSLGADLVLELPFPFSALSAESFAKSAVSILSRIGICDTIAFGSEIENEKELHICAGNLLSQKFQAAFSAALKENKGVGFPLLRERVYTELFGKTDILSSPNASLGVEYLLATRSFKADLSPFVVERKGETITSQKTEGEFLSATALRKMVENSESLKAYVPDEVLLLIEKETAAGRFPVFTKTLSPILFYLLKTKDRKELSSYYGFSALCDRAKHFAGESRDLEDLVEKMKNATFTDSRIRRGLLALLCNIPRFAEKEMPSFSMVLGANEKGREMLSEMKKASCIPVFTKPAHALQSKDPVVKKQFSREAMADEIYAMAFPVNQGEAYFLKKSPVIF